jgi:DNA-binding CsgD family transcriptional regulator/PAS domain-containing protein
MFENPEQAFGGTARLLALVESIYAAVQQPSLWPVVLEGIAEAVHGESTTLFGRLPREQLFSMARTDPEAWEGYAGHYASINPMMQRCDEVFPDGIVRYGHLALACTEFEKTEFYNDFFLRHDMHHSMGLKIPLANLPAAYISCQRPKVKGPFEEREGLVYRTLLPHLQRALTLYVQLTQTQSNVLGLETALDSLEHAVFGLNRQGRVIFSNRQADAIVRTADAIRLSNGKLSSVFPEQNRRLQAALTDAVSTGSGIGISAGSALLIDRKSGENALRVNVTPFNSASNSTSPGISAQLAALVFVSDPARRPQSRGATLRALYGLTSAETRVADLLLQGLETRELAGRSGVTLESVRFQIKRVLSKTGTRRQRELINQADAVASARVARIRIPNA